jgi:large subunit ribosomal protein L15
MSTLELSNLEAAPGSQKNRKRIGRGRGSGTGKTSGRGQKGQKSRSGGSPHPWFEGGQMPLQRRLPKRGFTNIFKKHFEIVNLERLAEIGGTDPITPEMLHKKGIIRKLAAVKILGVGELKGPITIHAHKFSKSAVAKLEQAGGKAVIL